MNIEELSQADNNRDVRPKPRTRSRKDQQDLRKKVLRDQTCKHLTFQSNAFNTESSELDKPTGLDIEVQAPNKDQLPRISCEEKTLQIRRRLEKIIHKKESDQTKALELLQSLQKMKFTQKILDETKICFTIEALKLVVTDKIIVEKSETTLTKIKKIDSNEKKKAGSK